MNKFKRYILSLLLVLSVILIWQITENIINTNRLANNETGLEAFIPSPITIVHAYIESGDLILNQSAYTFSRAMVGFCIGILSAILLVYIFSLMPLLRNITLPILFGVNSFPVVGLAPAIVLAFGQGSFSSIIFISALMCYFPTLITLDTAFNNIDQDVLDLMHVMKAPRWQIIRYIRLPHSLPYLFLTMRLAIPASIIGATMGEWLGSKNGLGQLITVALYQLKPSLLYASLFLIVAVSILGIAVTGLLERQFVKWKYLK
ncbi:hypothetical protein A3H03_00835 [Candidatus Kuenenbacteria bacterium RIFCSPLOWO2_12_FULL_42_13]|uniref:Binding-protein-dependent transport system inner membrane component n=4 Tax=Candidatus Kueneniibacteriota TaxID=1752740 RepID=A0A0G0YUN9_9BACT|nr:MAG: binding-protein-dependent transport system inner membrane component [Candidatus Kuenenbacteria bacterium GW2011_GWA2_42_15]OGG91990.1 MAG: hypothetical protein A3H03_00835 [Candidatus Kuenenbacteria bacterium RIFCSPLOWO2_12_FULL_42_13]OGG95983.1 MAG: hypothetical protein A2V95_00370 [Candidatus Kuenenbacteria bacterium RBG_16_41_7]OGG98478.1 MAG: hypothetical protein A3E04_03655 [Candidatus Kuenenbacteria bacterium RIFCSPHIGHO2_12_FULL_42_14]